MRLLFIFTILIAFCRESVEAGDDILCFINGDQLHGKFSGINEDSSVIWNRNDLSEKVKFKGSEIRRVVLNGGKPVASLREISHIGLTNGDRIPGTIRELDNEQVVMDTKFGGRMRIPRDQVGLLAPNPLGGKVTYHGPFDSSEWDMITKEHPNRIPPPSTKGGEQDDIPRWKHVGASWYWENKGMGTALVRKTGMPDRAILQLDIAWKNRLSLAVGFHSNFKESIEPEWEGRAQPKGGRSNTFPSIFGDSYILHIHSNYLILYRSSIDADGKSQLRRVQANNRGLRIADSGKAAVEIRCDRLSGEILLLVDDKFVAQWSELDLGPGDGDGYAGKGHGFGFAAQSEDSSVRISEVLVAEWNGMPDSARSLQSDLTDTVLLANGTDRFSGKVTGLHDGLLKMESRFGNFEFPIGEVAEIRLAKSDLVESIDSSEVLRVRVHPLGRISGKPLGGDARILRMRHVCAGEIEVKLDSAVLLEFRDTNSFLDGWDDEF